MSLIDSHCHLDDSQFDGDREAAIERALAAGIEKMVAIGTGEGPPDLEAGIRLADRYPDIYATAGIHPQYASKVTADLYTRLRDLAAHPKFVALGEIGLDYYWKPFDREQQQNVFIQQLGIAAEIRKPIVIHCREAWEDTISILRKHWQDTGLPCILHCFTGGPRQAQEALDLGFYLSFAGVVTYSKAVEAQESAKIVPLDRLLVETDAPYLAPVPHRGKRNEPAFVEHTARRIAELRGDDYTSLAAATASNWRRICLPVLKPNG
ncbi:MAG: TatD family hydrolase [Bryobacteraceae bacterium]